MSKRFAVVMAALLCASSPLAHAQDTASPPTSPKLIVTIVVDQFSANLFNQYRSRWTGGLRRL
ncbi:MAG: alkaline phosphatase family protein, partial [Brevundimonas sp.]